jgi:two-component system chemotaxis response regulator CheB
MQPDMIYEAIVMGVSAGGLYALTHILSALPAGFPTPVIVVQHRSKDERFLLEEVLQTKCRIHIRQADEKEAIAPGIVYFAPADYHLLIEKDKTFSLSIDAPVNFSRPSVDILFETAADVYKNKLLGIILTGANKDGARGVKCIRKRGGTTIAQRPDTADFPEMPKSAITTGSIQHVMTLDEIRDFLLDHMQKVEV